MFAVPSFVQRSLRSDSHDMHEIIVSTGCLTPTHWRYIPLICSSTPFQGATHAPKNPDRRSGATSLWRRPRRQSSRQHRWHPRPRQPRRTTNFAARAACRPYFCQTENPELFDLAESIPGPPPPRNWARSLGNWVWCWSPRYSNAARRAVPQYRRGAGTRRRHRRYLPQDAHPRRSRLLRKFYLRPAISASRPSTPRSGDWACWCAGISGTRKRRD